jgi:hypothetical protein
LAPRSLTTTLTDAARAAVQASDWERDQEAWNLPRGGQDGAVTPAADHDEHTVADSPDEPEGEPPVTPE